MSCSGRPPGCILAVFLSSFSSCSFSSRMSGECTSQVTICEYQGALGVGVPMGSRGPCCDPGAFLAAVGGGSAIPSGGAFNSACGLGGGKGAFGSSCSSVVTGGSNIILGSGQASVMGSCSVSGSGSGSSCRTILKKTVESSLKTSVTY